jgi:SAM-dependent methyltransferase
MIRSLVDRLLPKYSNRRLVASLVLTLLARPSRFFRRLNPENLFLHRQFSKIQTHCCICDGTGSLYFEMPDRKLRRDHAIGLLRESLLCKSCGSSCRQRTLVHVFLGILRERFDWKASAAVNLTGQPSKVDIWDTDAFSPLSRILRSGEGCILSKYLPDVTFGQELESGVFNIDLQEISFESNRFDVILSSDIMEHVRNDAAAHREIFRCLKPGGIYIFTVPYRENEARTLRLVDTSSSRDIFLTTPHFHGDPITGGILAYRIYGRELIDELRAIGFNVQFFWLDLPAEGIFGGDCFVATKPKKFEATAAH